MITVAIVEDEPNELRALQQVLDGHDGFKCVGGWSTAETALAQVPRLNPDVVIVDLNLPRMQGLRLIWELKQRFRRQGRKCEILVHSIDKTPRQVVQAIQASASGYLIKGTSPQDLLQAVRDCLNGGSWMSPSIARHVIQELQKTLASPADHRPFTQRETEVLRLIAKGYRNDEIAKELSISENTIRTHIKHICEALEDPLTSLRITPHSSSNFRFTSASSSCTHWAASAPWACTRNLLPGPAASIIRPMMLLPLTFSSSFSTVSSQPKRLAVLTHRAAGRAWMPSLLTTVSSLAAISLVSEAFFAALMVCPNYAGNETDWPRTKSGPSPGFGGHPSRPKFEAQNAK